MLAVSAASPSLPFGSEAAPTLKSRRKVTSGDEFGNDTVAIGIATFPASAIGAKTDEAMMSAKDRARLLLRSILGLLLLRQGDDGAMLRDKVFLSHRLQVFGRDRRINLENFVDGFRR